MRQAAIALLAVPVSRAARVSAVMRRSTLARVSIAVGLSFVLGVGVLGAGQPATAIATRTDPIGPLSQAAFATTFSTDRDLSAAVTIAFATPMDRASVAAALKVQPAKACRPLVGQHWHDPDGLAPRSLVGRDTQHRDDPGGRPDQLG